MDVEDLLCDAILETFTADEGLREELEEKVMELACAEDEVI